MTMALIMSSRQMVVIWFAASLMVISNFHQALGHKQISSLDSWTIVVQNAGVEAMHMITLPTNKVVIFDRTNLGNSSINLPPGVCRNNPDAAHKDCTAHAVQYDPNSNTVRPLFLLTDTWCSSGVVLPNGTFMQTGGEKQGEQVIRILGEGPTDDWVELGNPFRLLRPRWYSTNQQLPDGKMIIVGGRNQPNYEFVPANPKAQAIPLALLSTAKGKTSEENLYPFVHLVPDGNLFIFANVYSILFDYKANRVMKTFPNLGSDPRNYPYSGTSVMLPLTAADGFSKVEILICGGAPSGSYPSASQRRPVFLPALNTCGRIEITAPTPTWVLEQMPGPRILPDGKILPTGEILLINGLRSGVAGWNKNRDPEFTPFLYHPKTHKFANQTSSTIARVYHSSCNVQSDGTLLIGGGNDQNEYKFQGVRFPTELRLEKYSPYYLNAVFNDRRFIITNAPAFAHLSASFIVSFTTPKAMVGSVPSVQISLYSPTFTTHGNSMGQRMVILRVTSPATLSFAGSNWQVTATAPPSGTITPPGYYMLTVLNIGTATPIPSSAVWIQIGQGSSTM